MLILQKLIWIINVGFEWQMRWYFKEEGPYLSYCF